MFRSFSLTGEQIRAARAMARLEQADLARRSGLSLETIKRLERIRGPVDANIRTLNAIGETFGGLGIAFDFEDGLGVKQLGHATLGAAASTVRPATTPEQMFRLIHSSWLRPDVTAAVQDFVADLLRHVPPTAAENGVTGVLLLSQGRCLQVLEGDRRAVMEAYGSTSADPRHASLQVIDARPATSRQFTEWTLCCGSFPSDQDALSREPAMKDGFQPEVLTPAAALGLLTLARDMQRSPPRATRNLSSMCSLSEQCLDLSCRASGAHRAAALEVARHA